ncbi:MAG TPA: hypothetical protein PLO24_01685 [Bacteroidales bacterium]|jgi:hypothetical protein|nr:hypothetical protein [Bacteroidales bacterium]HOS72686.1 hypothetical protein [Bacteroidales bacterium]HQH24820.1 hypothetical protein [Bacteroidales bacterium]
MKVNIYLLLTFVFLITFSCRKKAPEKISFTPVFSTLSENSSADTGPETKYETYYGLLTPVEICSIFNRLGVPYNNAALNPVSNSDLYMSMAKAAVNTGIYGVDFGYLKMFGLGQEVINYMVTIRRISGKLGIPDYLMLNPLKQIESDIADPDTVTALMEKAFSDLENHLMRNERESIAGLMLMGGWVEAMFIATQLAYDHENPDPVVIQKIAEQKYTLKSLLSFMKNYYDDPVVVYYTKKLKFLNNYFDSFDIFFKPGDLEIDTLKKVLRSSGADMTITLPTLDIIKDYVAKLRTEMVSP